MFHKKDKVFATYSGEFCMSFVLFDRVFRSLSMTSIWGRIHQGYETFIGILEADSVHLFHLQLYFFSQWNTRIEVYAVYRWAVAFFVSLISFADLLWLLLFEEAFIKVVKLSVSILEADSLPILESIREASFVRSIDGWRTENKAPCSLHHAF